MILNKLHIIGILIKKKKMNKDFMNVFFINCDVFFLQPIIEKVQWNIPGPES